MKSREGKLSEVSFDLYFEFYRATEIPRRYNTGKYLLIFVSFSFCLSSPRGPVRAYPRLSITRIVLGIGVTSFRLASFLPACRRDTDRNRGPGRVPGSPRNLSIRPTRSPPRRPPTYSFYPSLSPLPSSPTLSSTTVPSPIYTRPFDSSTSFESSFSPNLPFPARVLSTSPSTLLFHFCRCSLFPSRSTGHTVSALSLRHRSHFTRFP